MVVSLCVTVSHSLILYVCNSEFLEVVINQVLESTDNSSNSIVLDFLN